MEIKKEDLVLIRSFEDRVFYGIRADFLDEEPTEIEVIVEKEPVIVPVPLSEEEVMAIAKAKEIEDLKTKLAELEE